jgi:replicative DNA helicase
MALSTAQDDYEDMKLFVDDAAKISILEMKNKCRRLKAEHGLDLVIIDYLQLMSLDRRTENRVNEISEITRSIKILAKELEVPVIMLSQLSRDSEKRSDHRLMLSDLRDSGSIEQDADIVIFLKRENVNEQGGDDPAEVNPNIGNVCDVIVAKHRSGPTGMCSLAWVGKYTKFGNLAHSFDEKH